MAESKFAPILRALGRYPEAEPTETGRQSYMPEPFFDAEEGLEHIQQIDRAVADLMDVEEGNEAQNEAIRSVAAAVRFLLRGTTRLARTGIYGEQVPRTAEKKD